MSRNILVHDRVRVVGFYDELKKAQLCVEEDWASFDEAGYYNYIVIELTVESIYNAGAMYLEDDNQQTRWWYHYENQTWVPCECPIGMESIINYGIG
jgi:hypothetical protein